MGGWVSKVFQIVIGRLAQLAEAICYFIMIILAKRKDCLPFIRGSFVLLYYCKKNLPAVTAINLFQFTFYHK